MNVLMDDTALIDNLQALLTSSQWVTASKRIKSRKKGDKWLYRVGSAKEALTLRDAIRAAINERH
jgi:hypothetical protein